MGPVEDLEKGPEPDRRDNIEPMPDENRTDADQTDHSQPVENTTRDGNSENLDDSETSSDNTAAIRILESVKNQDGNSHCRQTWFSTLEEFSQRAEAQQAGNDESLQFMVVKANDASAVNQNLQNHLFQRELRHTTDKEFIQQLFKEPLYTRTEGGSVRSSCMRESSMNNAQFYRMDSEGKVEGSTSNSRFAHHLDIWGIAVEYTKSQQLHFLRLPHTILVNFFDNDIEARGEREREKRLHAQFTMRHFVADMAKLDGRSVSGPELFACFEIRFFWIILEREQDFFGRLDSFLSRIDVDMGNKRLLILSMMAWQSILGVFRSILYSRLDFKRHIARYMTVTGQSIRNQGQDMKEAYVEYEQWIEDGLRHLESTTNALTSVTSTLVGTASIVESNKAVKQAQEVTKLTQLAFFFIPLTFVAGIFGMNVHGLSNVSIWV